MLDGNRSFDSRAPATLGTLPGLLDISILVLDPATAAHLASGAVPVTAVQALVSAANTTNADECLSTLPAALKPGTTVFTTRVQLNNAP